MDKIDTRGMSCPQPVLMTKNAVKSSPNEVHIIVDNNTAKGNVERFLKSSGYSNISFSGQSEDCTIIAKK
ncbi:Sulfurtransferase TusA [Peptoclostridium litorale DSM 5388]|uniref:UPF0033 domain-containing protein n=1 Tax=Peptoclostridium litorale DSM 5388 TaxID=1121324 RepID=A0A069RHS6_PEPLI|nr:sulfurtransferase TusA family protein [Peptoclostridium litorale]KDR96353.1 hypothetical protein CLIT_4c01910 [Peptoclostridium litorale DSM 5388]SIO26856.1 Sulfurtransferase TusA [Peptoclostridium litorale DSM 5388]